MDSFEKSAEDDALLDKSDISMSDSWTVLDSSHCKEDGDLSDAESVEVLAHEEPQNSDNENFTPECQSEDCTQEASEHDASSDSELHSVSESSVNPDEAAATAAAVAAGVAVAAATATAAPHARRKPSEVRFKHQLLRLILKLSIVSLSVDIMFIMTLLFFLRDQRMLCNNKSGGLADEPSLLNSIDPLPLQINRMVSGWKKDPQEEHVIARQLFKLMLAFYSRGDITSSLHELHKGIEDHDQSVNHARDTYGINHVKYRRHVVTLHLARSVATILGPHDESDQYSAKLHPESNASSSSQGGFTSDAELQFEDRYSPTVFEFNDTTYLNLNKLLPSYRLHLNLGSPIWNQYFWDVYHGRQLSEVSDGTDEEADVEDEEDTIEEPENSPLDFGNIENQSPESESTGANGNRNIHYALAPDDNDENEFVDNHDEEDFFKGDEAPMPLDILRSEIRREEAKKREEEEREKVHISYESGTRKNKIEKEKKASKGKNPKVKRETKDRDEKMVYKEQDHGKKKKRDKKKAQLHKDMMSDERISKRTKPKDEKFLKEHEQLVKKKSKGKEGKEKLRYDGKFDAQLKEKYKKFQEFIEEEKKHERFIRRQFGDEFTGDWNSRMARGREKMREDHDKEGWIFERARARRNLREELRSL